MSMFRVNVVAVNPKDDRKATPPVEVLVDTGSELTWLPADILTAAGIQETRKRTFQTATKQTVTRPVGYAILRSEGFETIDEVVLAEPGDMSLLGVRTIEGFGVMVDNVAHRFVATNTIVAAAKECVYFADIETKRRALGFLAGRFSFTTYLSGQVVTTADGIAALAISGIPFRLREALDTSAGTEMVNR